MKRPLPYLYLYQPDNEHVRYSSGVEFQEFIAAHGVTNLILVKHGYIRQDPDPHISFVVIEPQQIEALCGDDPYSYGDFHLLDVPDLGTLERLSKQEIAEILYLSHMSEPLSSPFLPGLGNSFVYLAHDDWWFTKTFFRDGERFYTIYGDILRHRIGRIHRRKLPPCPPRITDIWRDWSRQGLYIDLYDVVKSRDEFTLNVYLIGADRAPYSPGSPSHGIDAIMNDEEQYKRSSRRGLLRCYKRQWSATL